MRGIILEIILGLGNKFGNLFVFAFILSRIKSFRNLIGKKPVKILDKIVLSLVFGIFGIIGTYFSIEFQGALINTRIIGVATAGLLGGPMVGLLAGLVAGIHRGLIDIGGFTTVACAVSTPLEGLMSGYMGRFSQDKKNRWVYVALTGIIGESMRKVSVLIFSKPFEAAIDLVKAIWIPMVIVNSLGLVLLYMIIETIFNEQEKMGAQQAYLTLKIADKTLPYLKQGITSEKIGEVARIIYSMTDFCAVSLTDTRKIIAHVGIATPRHAVGNPIVTQATFKVLETGESIIMEHCTEENCECVDCTLESSIIVPLKENEKIIGTLKLYKEMSSAITTIDVELGSGLAKLFSTQLTMGRLEHNSQLLAAAELKALQAQINPHFFFNSLTVIGSFCRINPQKARALINHLSNIFRNNLNLNKELVDLNVELSHVSSYVEIEKARFEDKLKVKYDIDTNIYCLLPPLTIQPIVENAIKHGLLPKKNGGTVTISSQVVNKDVIIRVIDDGIGIPVEKQPYLLNDINKDSIGINNVNHRLVGMFGEEYGLKIESIEGKGTTVTLTIPCVRAEMECERYA